MAKSEFRVRMEGLVSIVEVRGPVDTATAASLIEFVLAAAKACRAVHVDLDNIESMTQEAAALLLFHEAPWQPMGENVTLRTNGRPGREAVLHAYARRRGATLDCE